MQIQGCGATTWHAASSVLTELLCHELAVRAPALPLPHVVMFSCIPSHPSIVTKCAYQAAQAIACIVQGCGSTTWHVAQQCIDQAATPGTGRTGPRLAVTTRHDVCAGR
jgi:hypothetical protein